jgi:hypothetical protein
VAVQLFYIVVGRFPSLGMAGSTLGNSGCDDAGVLQQLGAVPASMGRWGMRSGLQEMKKLGIRMKGSSLA